MKRVLLVSTILIGAFGFLLSSPAAPASASYLAQSSNPGGVSDALCLPGIYLGQDGEAEQGDCTPLGPSAYLTAMARKGVTFPLTALPAHKPDPTLTQVNVRYGQVHNANAPVFGSVEEAMTGSKKNAIGQIDSPFAYISYTDEQNVDGRRFYMIEFGQWMTANDVARVGSVPLFQGLEFTSTPERPFGWVLTYITGPIPTKRTPGTENDDYTENILNNHQIVQIYQTQKVGDQEWYMVGPDEWVPQKVVARVIPNIKPPEGVTGGRWIEVNLAEQTLAVYDGEELVFATLIASGLEPFWTRPGLFKIAQKLETTPMRGSFEADRSDAYYLEDVPWTMYFDQARALHGAYWRANLGFPQSHGCVNLSVGDSHWLFNWADVGDFVYVWDPSGKTPTDPSLYGSGGY